MAHSVFSGIKKNWSMVLSLVVAAAFLPVVLLGALNPDSLRFMTQADQPNELRIWLEPAEVVTRPGVPVQLKVMGEYSSESSFIPQVKAIVKSDSGLSVSPAEINFLQPFRGRVELGSIKVTAESEGSFAVQMDETSVNTTLPNLLISSAKALVVARK